MAPVRIASAITGALLTMGIAMGLGAQPDITNTLWATRDESRPGASGEIRVLGATPYDSFGWSFGVCNDPTVAQVVEVHQGATTATVNGGDPPDFEHLELYADGWTSGVVISFLGLHVLPASRCHEFYVVDYAAVGPAGTSTPLTFCTTLGTPPTAVVYVYGGASIVPATHAGEIAIVDAPYEFIAPREQRVYAGTGSTTFAASIGARQYDAPFIGTSGASFSLAYDTGRLVALSFSPAGPVAKLTGGPDYFAITEFPEGLAGSVVYDMLGVESIALQRVSDLITVQFETTLDDLFGDYFELRWADGIGVPFVVNQVDAGSTSNGPVFRHGFVRIVHGSGVAYLRGDCDRNGGIAIGDAIESLQHLFSGLAVFCLDACDADGDGALNIADPLYSLNFGFLGGPPPPAPFPSCAVGATMLGCDSYPCP
ncbi:MAG: hypothetical protein KDC38_07250 [Planctomycetes bacterium]|nr:hypothetical protein [Planctomycetota bacterium]